MNRDGQEKKSGTIRRDPARVRCRRNDPKFSEETWSAPANGAASDSERDPAGEEEGGKGRAETGVGERTHRPDAGGGPRSAPESALATALADLLLNAATVERTEAAAGDPARIRRFHQTTLTWRAKILSFEDAHYTYSVGLSFR